MHLTISLCVLFALASLPAGSAEIPQLFKPIPSTTINRQAAGPELRGLRVVRRQTVAIDRVLLESGAPFLGLSLFESRPLVAERIEWRAAGDGPTRVWAGRAAGATVILAVTGDVVHGSVQTAEGEFFEIRPAGKALYEIRQLEYNDEPVEDGIPVVLAAAPEAAAAAAVSNTIVDVLMLYTAAARQAAGGTTAIQNKIALAITEINQSYLGSGIPLELRLVRSAEVSYDESSGINTALTRLTTPGDTFLDEAQTLRNQTGADLVQLWINGPGSQGGTVGLAWLMSSPSTYFESYAYSVVEVNFAAGPYYSAGHEFGHNQGAAHDRANASNPGAYSYAYGYQKATGAYPFRTIMSYACPNVYCPKLNYWSNPELAYQGQPIGVASTAADSADNRLALTNTRATVAAFRNASQQAPVPQSVTPSSGAGSSATFTAVYSDGNGGSDISGAYLMVHSQVRADAGCFLYYNRAANSVQLLNDAATAWSVTTAGGPATLSNSQCSLAASGVQATLSGNSLQVTFPITFKTAFSGARNVYLLAIDSANSNSNWYLKGTWTVSGAQSPPRPVSVTPISGSGTSATFSGVYTDANGGNDVNGAYFLIHSQIRADAGCFLYYNRLSNTVQLLNDAAGAWSAPVAAGGASTLSNSQCSIAAATVAASVSGNNLTVTMTARFSGTFTGTKNVYLLAIDSAGANSNWSQMGTWTVPVSQQTPAPASVTPSSATGATVTLSALFTDLNGAADITGAYFLIHSQIRADSGCFVYYNRAANTFQVLADLGWPWSAAITPGSGTASNSRCTINGAGSSVSASGNNLTVNLSVTAKAAFGGMQNVYLLAIDSSGANSNWHLKGTWATGY